MELKIIKLILCFAIICFSFPKYVLSQNAIINNNYITVNPGDTNIVNIINNNFDPDEGEYFKIKNFSIINTPSNTINHTSKTDSTIKFNINPLTSNLKATILCNVNEIRNGFVLATHKDTLFVNINKSKRFEMLDVNNIISLFKSDGILYYNPSNFSANFYAPQNNSIYCRFSSSINFSGLDNQNNLRVCIGEYNEYSTDYQTGIISNDQSFNYKQKYNRVWCLTKNKIEEHIQNYTLPNYIIDSTLILWPCNGDTTKGELFQMADFKDLNNNSIYEPLLGEYPLINGDKCIYFIINDKYKKNTHGGLNIGLEIHVMAYAYENINNKATYNSQFVEFTIYNRSNINYNDFIISMLDDIDLGLHLDDYNGCDTILNLAFGYNSSAFDLNSTNSYGNFPPATGLLFLNNKIESFFVSDNEDNLPNLNIEYQNVFNGKFKNGNNIYYGGNGVFGNPGVTNTIVKKMYYGNIMDSTQWSEYSAKNISGDRKYYISTLPKNFASNEKIKFDVALIFAQDSSLNHLQNVGLLKQYAQSIKEFYQVIGKEEIEKPQNNIKIYPNPTMDKFYFNNVNDNELYNIKVYNLSGKILMQKKSVKSYTPIDISHLEKGIYLIHFSNNKNSFSSKLIKI